MSKKRINITIPKDTLEAVDRIREVNRSEFIDRALKKYTNQLERDRVKNELKKAYQERAEEDIKAFKEWQSVGQELWQNLENS